MFKSQPAVGQHQRLLRDDTFLAPVALGGVRAVEHLQHFDALLQRVAEKHAAAEKAVGLLTDDVKAVEQDEEKQTEAAAAESEEN